MTVPLSRKDSTILEHLSSAWNLFVQLDKRHPMHQLEFCKAIHDAQKSIMWRKAQDNYPDIFPITQQRAQEDEF